MKKIFDKLKQLAKTSLFKASIWSILITLLIFVPFFILAIILFMQYSYLTLGFWLTILILMIIFIVIIAFSNVIYTKLLNNYENKTLPKKEYLNISFKTLKSNPLNFNLISNFFKQTTVFNNKQNIFTQVNTITIAIALYPSNNNGIIINGCNIICIILIILLIINSSYAVNILPKILKGNVIAKLNVKINIITLALDNSESVIEFPNKLLTLKYTKSDEGYSLNMELLAK